MDKEDYFEIGGPQQDELRNLFQNAGVYIYILKGISESWNSLQLKKS